MLERMLLLDLDGNGEVDLEEFMSSLTETGLSESKARSMFEEIDADGRGATSFSEFLGAVKAEMASKRPGTVATAAAPGAAAAADVGGGGTSALPPSRLDGIRQGRTDTLTKRIMGDE